MALFTKHSSPPASDMPSSSKITTPQASPISQHNNSPTIHNDYSVTPPTTLPPIDLKIINQFFPPDYAATGQLIEELAHNLKEFGRIDVCFRL
jgi:hypothetical protein